MDSKDVKQEEEAQGRDKKNEKGRQKNTILLTLLLVVGGISYLYFFTDVIKPQNESKPAETPGTQVMKMPLPLHEGVAVKTDAKPATAEIPVKGEAPKTEADKVVPAAPLVAQQPQVVKMPLPPHEGAVDKPATAPATAETSVKTEIPKTEPAKVVSTARVAGQQQKVKGKHQKAEAVKPVENTSAAKAPRKAEPEANGRWTVLVGSYVLERSLAADQAKVIKAGLKPVVKPGEHKKTIMNRLLLSEYTDRSSAKVALDKLRKHTSDAFILDHAGKHYVYAGSYVLDSLAVSEKERLTATGFALTLKREIVSIPSKVLSAGVYNDEKTAEAAVMKLKDAGIKATYETVKGRHVRED